MDGDAGARQQPRKGTGRIIQSVDRAIDVLEALARQETECTLNEIGAQAGINLSTCHHVLNTLMRRGYVGQNRRTKMYYLGNKALELAQARSRQIDLVRIATPVMRRLRQDTGESVHLARMQGHDLTILVALDSPQPVRVDGSLPGLSSAAHATAHGKAILAWLPETEIAAIFADKGMFAFTDNTLTSLGELLQELALVRRHGYATDMEEFQSGVVSVGQAIRDHTGAVIASISCSAPAMRATEEHLGKLTESVRQAAKELSSELGSG